MYFRMHRNVSVDKKKNDLDVPRTLKIVCINVRENIISIAKKRHYKIQLWKILLYIKTIYESFHYEL